MQDAYVTRYSKGTLLPLLQVTGLVWVGPTI